MTRDSISTGAELFVRTLEEYGVEHVFGNPGTTELPIMNAIGESDELTYILGLHEDVAVGMAGGYASTRRYHGHHDDVMPVGVVNLHLSAGLAHGLGNLYAAKMTGTPLVVTAGNHSTDFRHEEPIMAADLVEMSKQFTKWSDEILDVSALPSMLRRAFRVALTPPTGPVFLGLPLDVMMAETNGKPERLGAVPTAGRGDQSQISAAADCLVAADNPVMVLGDHVARAGSDAVNAAVELAEAAGLRVHGEILSCEINFPTTHDQWVSHVPPDEGVASSLLDTDTLLLVGCSTNTTLTRHDSPLVGSETTCVHVSQDSWQIGKNQPAYISILGDPGDVLGELAVQVSGRLGTDQRERRLESVRETKRELEAQPSDPSAETDRGISKPELVACLREATDDAFIVDEGVTSKYPLLAEYPFEAEGLISNKGGGLGYGLPAAVGAAIAEDMSDDPRQVVGYVGDGSYQYYPHTLYSAARYDVDVTVVVSNNSNYRILKDNTLKLLGGAEDDYDFEPMEFEPAVNLVANARSHGADAQRVEESTAVAPVIVEALSSEGPTVLDITVCD